MRGRTMNNPLNQTRAGKSPGPWHPLADINGLLGAAELGTRPVPPGEPGELLVPSDFISKQYWNSREESAKSYVDIRGEVWYRMNDFVRLGTAAGRCTRRRGSDPEGYSEDVPRNTSSCAQGRFQAGFDPIPIDIYH